MLCPNSVTKGCCPLEPPLLLERLKSTIRNSLGKFSSIAPDFQLCSDFNYRPSWSGCWEASLVDADLLPRVESQLRPPGVQQGQGRECPIVRSFHLSRCLLSVWWKITNLSSFEFLAKKLKAQKLVQGQFFNLAKTPDFSKRKKEFLSTKTSDLQWYDFCDWLQLC